MIAADLDHDHPTARRLLQESLTLYRTLGFPRFVALVLLSLGDVALAEGNPARARELLHESLNGMREVGENLGIPGALDTVAHLAVSQGQAERAVRLAGAAEQLRTASGTHPWPVAERTRTHWLASARNTLDETVFRAAWEQGRTTTQQRAIAYALEEAPRLDTTGEDPDAARIP